MLIVEYDVLKVVFETFLKHIEEAFAGKFQFDLKSLITV